MMVGSMPGMRYRARQFALRLSRSTMILPLYRTIIHFHHMQVRDTTAQAALTTVLLAETVRA
jgi:hypothetical protein